MESARFTGKGIEVQAVKLKAAGEARCTLALRFQDKDDDVDRAVKEARSASVFAGAFVFVLAAAIGGVVSWLSGDSLRSYEQYIAVGVACLWAGWILVPIYEEFLVRTKEIDGKVSAIEKAVNGSNEGHEELLERLTAIEDKMDAMQRELESRIDI